jgi:hypothetical protein
VDASGPWLSRVRGVLCGDFKAFYRRERKGKSAKFAKKGNVWRDSFEMDDEIVTIGFVNDDPSS